MTMVGRAQISLNLPILLTEYTCIEENEVVHPDKDDWAWTHD